jgi:predicted site-specific integrase-resolvase
MYSRRTGKENKKMANKQKHSFELQIQTGKGSNEYAELTVSNVAVNLTSDDKLQKLLDLLEVPKGTRVNISTKASTSVVR